MQNLASTHRVFAALLASSLSFAATAAGQPAPASRSVAELRAAAASGSAEAEYELAERLAVDGVDEHRAEAVLWLKRAAAKGHADAQTHLSWAYHVGVGVTRNDVEAVKWERLAAEKGQASAQYYLASDYEFGLGGLPKDIAQAAHLVLPRGGTESSDRAVAARRPVRRRTRRATQRQRGDRVVSARDDAERLRRIPRPGTDVRGRAGSAQR